MIIKVEYIWIVLVSKFYELFNIFLKYDFDKK